MVLRPRSLYFDARHYGVHRFMTDAQTAYRQALRDITDDATSLDDVTWPVAP